MLGEAAALAAIGRRVAVVANASAVIVRSPALFWVTRLTFWEGHPTSLLWSSTAHTEHSARRQVPFADYVARGLWA